MFVVAWHSLYISYYFYDSNAIPYLFKAFARQSEDVHSFTHSSYGFSSHYWMLGSVWTATNKTSLSPTNSNLSVG